jgi:hypothetical protein
MNPPPQPHTLDPYPERPQRHPGVRPHTAPNPHPTRKFTHTPGTSRQVVHHTHARDGRVITTTFTTSSHRPFSAINLPAIPMVAAMALIVLTAAGISLTQLDGDLPDARSLTAAAVGAATAWAATRVANTRGRTRRRPANQLLTGASR